MQRSSGFTLIELMVTIAIFAFMTALILARYNSFSSGTLLNNLAYDIALNIRQAQTYGLSVRTTDPTGANASSYSYPYGVSFATQFKPACGQGSLPNSQAFLLYFDDSSGTQGSNNCLTQSEIVSTYNLKQGAYISSLCASTGGSCNPVTYMNITFQRPDPSANICTSNDTTCGATDYSYAEIVVTSGDNTASRTITVRQNGQVSVQ